MQVEAIFHDRRHAGRELATRLMAYAHKDNVLALALPRGGVPVGYEVAQALQIPLEIFIVRKLGVPGHEELAMGAIASGGIRVLNHEVVDQIPNAETIIAGVATKEMQELERREFLYRGRHLHPNVRGKTAIVIDDGLATGSTMRAAVLALRQCNADKIVVAVPVASKETCLQLSNEADEVICAETPPNFMAVGQFYADFSQTSDTEVSELLAMSAQHLGHAWRARLEDNQRPSANGREITGTLCLESENPNPLVNAPPRAKSSVCITRSSKCSESRA